MRTRLPRVIGTIGVLLWLALPACSEQIPEGSLPTFDVTSGSVVTPDAATALAEALGIPSDDLLDEDGVLRYLDEGAFMALPMSDVTPLSLSASGDGDEQVGPLMGFDFAAINLLPAIPEARALHLAAGALAAANLTPSGLGIDSLAATPGLSYGRFQAFDVKGAEVAEARLDGQVAYDLVLGTRRLVGPGALVQLTFDADEKPTQAAYALRGLQQAGYVPIVASARAEDQATALYLAANPTVGTLDVDYQCEEVVYYAPPLALSTVTKIFPHYDCAGTATTTGVGTEQAQEFELLRTLVPAVADVPVATLTANLAQGMDAYAIDFAVTVSGGTAPYTVVVSSGTTEYVKESTVNATAMGSYPVYRYSFKSEEPFAFERVLVSVSDANGLVGVPVSQDVAFPSDSVMALAAPELAPAVAGVTDVGITRGVCDMGAGMQSGFHSRMLAGGVTVRFNFSCMASWERDFRENTTTGLDPSYVDNADMTLFIGHGWPGGFSFASAMDKGVLVHGEPYRTVLWGNQDLEWLALASCSVLREDAPGSGGLWFERWGEEFDGLHLLLGFHTNAYAWSGFGGRFADWMLGRRLGPVTLPPAPIVASWFQASKEQQPIGVVPAVMGVYGESGVSNYGDFFHGRGPVGPDLRGDNIEGWWYLRLE